MLKLIAHIKMTTRRSLRQVATALRVGNWQAQSARLLSYAAMLTLLMLPVSCSMFDTNVEDCLPNTGNATTYLQVKIQVAGDSNTRAKGGEDGDGREEGVNRENDVNNVTIFLYEAGKGINEADNTPIAAAFYFDGLNNNTTVKKDITNEVKTSQLDIKKKYHILVVANMGNQTGWKDNKTLGEIRDMLITKAWDTSEAGISSYDNFVMTSEKDATLDFTQGKGTEEDPYKVETDIERVAARIDFDTNLGTYNETNGTYTYKVTTEGNAENGLFVLSHVKPFNELTYGAYCIKRVSIYNSGTPVTYLGEETADGNKKATNYVVDALWGAGVTRGAGHYTNVYSETPTIEDTWKVKAAMEFKDGTKGYILDYTMENTSGDNAIQWATGLYFQGTLYNKSQVNEDGTLKEDATGTTKTYVYYIRHSDPDGNGTTSDPMHYGIVRNNIYRISISKVTVEGIKWQIKVKPWALYRHSEIIM